MLVCVCARAPDIKCDEDGRYSRQQLVDDLQNPGYVLLGRPNHEPNRAREESGRCQVLGARWKTVREPARVSGYFLIWITYNRKCKQALSKVVV